MSFCLVTREARKRVNGPIDDMLGVSLRVGVVQANLSPLPRGHTTGWRTMPFFMYSQASGGSERVTLEDGRTFTARPGELVALPAGVRHSVEVTSQREVRHWAHIHYFLLNTLDLFSLYEVPVLVPRSIGEPVGEAIQAWVRDSPRWTGEPLLLAARQGEFGLRLLALLAPDVGVCQRNRTATPVL